MAHPVSHTGDTHEPHAAGHEHHNSFMPLWLTLATTLLFFGLMRNVRGMTDGVPVVAAIGFLGIAASVWGWVREDVRELRGKPYHVGHSPYMAGTLILILSEVVIFGILFFFYFWSRAHTPNFVPPQIEHLNMVPIIANTVILLSSGATVHTAQVFLKKGNMRQFRVWLGITVLLGLAFLAGQVLEYQELIHEGLTAPTSVYATAFYSLTGVHGIHVAAGVVVLAIIWGLSFTGFISKERASGVEGAFIYWHFVDAIWVLVFTFVYLRVI